MIDNVGEATIDRPHKKGPIQPLTYNEKVALMARQTREQEIRQQEMKEQLMKDRTPIPGDRRPIVRKYSQVQYGGFYIGDQRDESQINNDRRKLQMSYKEQLEGDLQLKARKEREIEDGSSPNAKRDELLRRKMELMKEEGQYKGGLIIGRDPNAEKDLKKINAVKLRDMSLADRGGKAETKTLRELHDERSKASADTNGYYIGADESNLRLEKKEIAKKYYNQLSSDISSSPTKGESKGKTGFDDYTLEGEYIDKTGLTGFQIGGLSSDVNKSQQHVMHTQKLAKQTAYRQSLLEQQQIATQMEREKEARVRDEMMNMSSLPYMRT